MRRLIEWPAGARWAATAAFFAGVNWMMLAPSSTFREIHVFLAHQDKLAHAGIFLALAGMVRWSLAAGKPVRVPLSESGKEGVCGRAPWSAWIVWCVFAALLVYAGAIELSQPLLKRNGRAFEWLDMACNFAGVVAGWLVYRRGDAGRRSGAVVAPERAGGAAGREASSAASGEGEPLALEGEAG